MNAELVQLLDELTAVIRDCQVDIWTQSRAVNNGTESRYFSLVCLQDTSSLREPSTLRSYTRSESASVTPTSSVQQYRADEQPVSHWHPTTTFSVCSVRLRVCQKCKLAFISLMMPKVLTFIFCSSIRMLNEITISVQNARGP